MTQDLDERYGVTVSFEGKSRRLYVVRGDIFDRKTQQDVGHTVTGEGRTLSAAQDRAVTAARSWVRSN